MTGRRHGSSDDRKDEGDRTPPEGGTGTAERMPGLVYGLIFGPGVAMLFAIILELDLAMSLVYGAGLGLAVGLVIDAEHARRHPDEQTPSDQ